MDLGALHLLGLAAAALIAGGVNALAGGGSLISFPALTAVGVPPLSANITNTVALTPGYIGGTLAQRPDLAAQRPRVALVAVPAIAGGFTGATLLLLTGEDRFEALVPWLVLAAAVLIAADPWMKRWVKGRLATADATGSAPAHRAGLALAAFGGAVYGGFFGAGLGIILLALYSLVVPDTLVRINALKQCTSFLANGAAAVLLMFIGDVVWTAVAVMAVCALAGGALAGRYVRNASPTVLRGVVVVVSVTVAAVYFTR